MLQALVLLDQQRLEGPEQLGRGPCGGGGAGVALRGLEAEGQAKGLKGANGPAQLVTLLVGRPGLQLAFEGEGFGVIRLEDAFLGLGPGRVWGAMGRRSGFQSSMIANLKNLLMNPRMYMN